MNVGVVVELVLAVIGGITLYILVCFAGMAAWCAWADYVRNQPDNKPKLKELKKQWRKVTVEER